MHHRLSHTCLHPLVSFVISQTSAAAGAQDGRLVIGSGFSVAPGTGRVPGYGRATVTAMFAPTTAAECRTALRLTFKAPAQRKLKVAPLTVALRGVSRDVPIFLERSLLDFKCCTYDHTFRWVD